MSNLSSAYGSYMTHFHKFKPRLDTFSESFNQVYDLIQSGQYIDCDLDKRMDDYPKYPCIYQYFNKTKNFDLWKIYNCVLDTVDKLKDYITSKSALSLRIDLDKIPNDIIKIRNDVNLQYTFSSRINDLFDLKQHFHDYSRLKKIINFYNSLDETSYNEGFNDSSSSFIHTFLFDFLFRQQLRNSSNFSSKLGLYCIDNDIFSGSNIKNSFNTFIDDNSEDFFYTSSQIILQSLYSMSKIDPKVTNLVLKSIEHNSTDLKEAFENYIDYHIGYPSGEIIQFSTNSLYLVLGSNLISSTYNNFGIFDQSFQQSTSYAEDEVFSNFMNNVSSTSVQSYLFMSYLYKFWPIKFINVLPMIMSKYAEEIIKPDVNQAFSRSRLESIFSLCLNKVDYDELISYLNTTVDNDYLSNLVIDEEVIRFSFFVYFTKLFDGFMESDLYKAFVTSIYKDVYKTLRDEGFISNTFNWNSCNVLFDLFFKSFIRSNLISGNVFSDLENQFREVFLSVLNNDTGDSKYDVSIDFSVDKTKSLYANIVNSHFDKLHNFIESMYLSSLTSNINVYMLGYFMKT